MTIGVRRTTTWVVAVLAVGLGAGCSSSGGKDTAGPNASNASTPAASVPASTPATAGTPADPATKQAITKAYTTFFGGSTTTAESEQALQHGASFRPTLDQQANGQYSKGSGTQVGAVSVRGQLAYVTFTITSNGKPLLANIKGYAVQEGGVWKVAAVTFCMLLKLQGSPPAVCNDTSITALPQ